MCGRFSLTTPREDLMAAFGLSQAPRIAPRVNVAPGTPIAVVRSAGGGGRGLAHLLWGFVPSWAKDPALGQRMINARGESVMEKPSFRAAFRRRRCLVPANGFFEWPKQKSEARPRQPYRIAPTSGEVIAFAGLWEARQGPNGEELETCAIITTESRGRLREIHPRSPVILDSEGYETWLSPATPLPLLGEMLRPWPDERLTIYPVSRAINDPRNQEPDLLKPVATDDDPSDSGAAHRQERPSPRQGRLF